MLFRKKCAIIYPVAQGYSSAGRVPVSKTVGRGFESSCPCQTKHHRFSVVFLFGTRFEARHAFKLQATISFLLSWCSLMPSLLGGVQNPPAPAMKKAIRVSEWLFSVKFVPTERVKYANACEIACGSEIRLRRVKERILFHIDQSRRRREIFHNF